MWRFMSSVLQQFHAMIWNTDSFEVLYWSWTFVINLLLTVVRADLAQLCFHSGTATRGIAAKNLPINLNY